MVQIGKKRGTLVWGTPVWNGCPYSSGGCSGVPHTHVSKHLPVPIWVPLVEVLLIDYIFSLNRFSKFHSPFCYFFAFFV
jgi:hypothetical protein